VGGLARNAHLVRCGIESMNFSFIFENQQSECDGQRCPPNARLGPASAPANGHSTDVPERRPPGPAQWNRHREFDRPVPDLVLRPWTGPPHQRRLPTPRASRRKWTPPDHLRPASASELQNSIRRPVPGGTRHYYSSDTRCRPAMRKDLVHPPAPGARRSTTGLRVELRLASRRIAGACTD
jgi:hypothetical protein